jgi:cation diffusion facilitator CzcD-associated flavoprotein CzcO
VERTGTAGVGHLDAVVIGAGFYMTKRLSDAGMRIRSFDAGSDVGGVWNWNRYPGARTDSPHHTYRFTFADDLLAEWEYSERYPPQPEVLGYLRHVAELYDLRRHYTFGTRVEAAVLDERSGLWEVTTDGGETVRATYVVTGVGLVSEPIRPDHPGADTFRGDVLHTSSWPHEQPDLAGKRVAVIGTGSSGIQLLPRVAEVASAVTVFQRTPNYVVPTGNRPVDDDDREEMRERYTDVARRIRNHPAGFPFEQRTGRSATVTPPAEREEIFRRMWERGGFSFLYETFDDLVVDENANALACDFVRRRIAEIVQDPATAATLTPDYVYGAKRPPTGDGYYQAFNLPHVSLVDLRATPIEEITPAGIRTTGSEHEFDVIVYATGFDASTGAFSRMDVRGRGGRSLADHWAEGPSTYLGLTIAGFPNLFMVAGPQSPFANLPPGAEQEGGWIADLIAHMRANGTRFVEPLPETERAWNRHVREVAEGSLIVHGEKVNSWFTGANIDGKARAFNVYFGGAHVYGDKLEAEAEAGYPGLAGYSDPAEAPVGTPADAPSASS